MLKRNVAIIFPPMIGDSIMAIALINEINTCGDIPYVYTTEYNFDTVYNLLISTQVIKISSPEKYTFDIIIDFLSNQESAVFNQNHQNSIKIGFPDGAMKYNINLKLPFNFRDFPATEIFLQALQLINIKTTSKQKFITKNKWVFNNQEIILIAPGAGNLNRCYELNDFIMLADKLIQIGQIVMFILGPSEIKLKDLIKNHKHLVSNNMSQALEILNRTKIVISSEGGFMHICGFLGLPLLGIFRVSKIKNWFPYQLHYQKAIGHETNDYINITKIHLNINCAINKIIEINNDLEVINKKNE
jgi:ADP-heptose:LPS heptosyltransferase